MTLEQHLSSMFADPHTADLYDVWVDDETGKVLYLIEDKPEHADDDGNVPKIGRLLDFLPDDHLEIIRRRFFLETEWVDEDGNDATWTEADYQDWKAGIV